MMPQLNRRTPPPVIAASVIRNLESEPPPQAPDAQRSELAGVKRRIVAILEAHGAGGMLTSEVLGHCTDLKPKSVSTQLTRMATSGVIKKIPVGKYRDGNIWHLADVTPSVADIQAKTAKAREIKYKNLRPGRTEPDHHNMTFSVADNGDLIVSQAEHRLTFDQRNKKRARQWLDWSETLPREDTDKAK